eukprot:464869-Amorphochlora_amoeboformis.AAC.1
MPSDSSFHDSLFDQAKPPSSHPKSPKPRLPTPIYTPIHCSSPDPIQFSNSTPIYTPKATPVHISKAHPKSRPSPGISAVCLGGKALVLIVGLMGCILV